MQLGEKQLTAINLCSSKNRIVGITGAAGTGKTTIMRAVYEELTNQGWLCTLCAPTGKAARRATQVTGIPAQTIHKLVEYPRPGDVDPKTGKPLQQGSPYRNRMNRLAYNCILIDEAPMVSKDLIRDLYEALPDGGIVRMFGDLNQLPPIDTDDGIYPFEKAIYETLPDGRRVPIGVVLDTIYRQGEGSGIISNGVRIIEGRYPEQKPDFNLIPTERHLEMLCKILDTADYRSLNNQIIVPGKKFWVGTIALNALLRRKLNPNPENQTVLERHPWDKTAEAYIIGVGDKVIVTKNWYDLGKEGILNGETGIVVEITAANELIVQFENETAAIPDEISVQSRKGEAILNPQKDVDLAYAITTHKSQGSEYDHVTYIIDKSHKWLLYRNNTYTAVTRARKHVNMIYSSGSMSRALSKTQLTSRRK